MNFVECICHYPTRTSAVDFFTINPSSIKSEPQKSIFFRFLEFSIMFDHSVNDRKIDIFFKIFFVNYTKPDIYFRKKNGRLFLYKMFLKLNFKFF